MEWGALMKSGKDKDIREGRKRRAIEGPTAPQSEHDAFIFESVLDQVSKPLEEKSDWFIEGAPRACT